MPPEVQNDCAIVLSTCPDADTATRLAGGLVENGLAACVNVVEGIRSIYRWQGTVHDERETLMIIKTTVARYAALERWIQENHPYDVPEVVALPVAGGAEAYLAWVSGQVR